MIDRIFIDINTVRNIFNWNYYKSIQIGIKSNIDRDVPNRRYWVSWGLVNSNGKSDG